MFSIRTKVISCFLLVLVLFMGASWYSYIFGKRSLDRLALVNEVFLPLSRDLVKLQGIIQTASEESHRVRSDQPASPSLTRMINDVYPYIIRKKFSDLERILDPEAGASAGRSAKLNHVAATFAEAKRKFEENSATDVQQKYAQLRTGLAAIAQEVDEECRSLTLDIQEESRERMLSGLVLSLFVGGLGFLTLLVSNRALAPLPVLITSLKKTASGDFSEGIKVGSREAGDIALLAKEYNRMIGALRERDGQIQKQQEELVQKERLAAVGKLSAEIVHEIRNPLNSISLNIDWLENELRGADGEIKRSLQSVSREIQRLNGIAESYLVRAKVPFQDDQKIEVHDLLGEILDFAQEEDRVRNISVVKQWAGREFFVLADRSRLKQAFLNIIKNAKEAMPMGGKLTVQTEASGNGFQVRISDTGHGMTAWVKKRTFEPFFTTKQSGTGIGLSVTREVIEQANGAIDCESSPGEGTTFTLQFPV